MSDNVDGTVMWTLNPSMMPHQGVSLGDNIT